MYMNKRQIVAALNKGFLDDVVKQLRTYGNIQSMQEFDIEEGSHAGAHRVMKIEHHGLSWEVSMHNGEVKSVGHSE